MINNNKSNNAITYIKDTFINICIKIFDFFKHIFNGVYFLLYPILKNFNEKNRHRRNLERKKKIEELEKQRIEIVNKRKKEQEEAFKKLQEYQAKRIKKLNNPKKIAKEQEKLSLHQKELEKQRLKNKELLQQIKQEKEKQIKKIQLKEQKRLKRKQKKEKNTIKEQLKHQQNNLRQEKMALKEQKRLQKLEIYKANQIEKQKRLEAKDRLRQEKQLEKKKRKSFKDKKTNDKYISQDYKKNSGLSLFNKRLKDLPQNLKKFFEKKYNNLTFVKNIKNKRDINRQALILSFEGEDAKKSGEKLTYKYTAKSPNGKIVTDFFDAYSKVEVHSFLLSEGYEVYRIKTSSMIQLLNSTVISTKIKTKDLIFFLTQLSTYVKSGISLVDSLKILVKQYKKKSYQKIFRAIIYDLTMGDNFSQALEKQKNSFPKLLINMIKASEMTGDLVETLDDMAQYYTESEKTRKQMITALMYPTIILIVALFALSFIMIYVVPKFVTIYESMDASKIPGITLAILAISKFLQKYYLLIFIIFVGIILLLRILYVYLKPFRKFFQWVAMHLPILGNIIIYNEVTMFTKTFGSLLQHNVFITDSMEILNKITSNEIYRELILDTITNLARGDRISAAFENHWAFPVPAYEMIVTGEKTGQLPEMMSKVSKYYQELHKNLVLRMKTFIEPVLIILLTAVVGVIIISIVIPMFNIYSVIQMQ